MPVNTGAFRAPSGVGGGGGDNNEGGSDKSDLRIKESRDNDIIDAKYGFNRISDEVRNSLFTLLPIYNACCFSRCAWRPVTC